MKVLITGGSGTLGREVATAAVEAGYVVGIGGRRSSPKAAPHEQEWAQIQLADGSGLATAVDGVEAVIHAATDPHRATAVDVEGTRHLIEACRVAGVNHLVSVSIVGIDEIPLAYYRSKTIRPCRPCTEAIAGDVLTSACGERSARTNCRSGMRSRTFSA